MADLQGEQSEFHSERGVFRAEYERELGQWLRRRLGWLCVAYACFQIMATGSIVFALLGQAEAREQLQPRQSLPATSPLEAVGEIAQDIAREVRRDAHAKTDDAPKQPIGRLVDRWWEDTIAPITDKTKSESAAPEDDDSASRAEPAGSEPASAETDGADLHRANAPLDAAAGIDPGDSWILWMPWWGWVLLNLPSIAVIAWFGLRIRPRLFTRHELVTAASRMIVILGFLTFALETGVLLASPEAAVYPLFSIFFWHLTASVFLPWMWRESLRPIVPLFVSWVLLRAGLAAGDHEWAGFTLTVLFAPLLFLPAVVLCYARLRWHQNRFKTGFVGRRFLQMRREFIQARAVHESLFPKPTDAGWVRFDFGYRPAADIGGDFIHAWTDDTDRFHVALIDVTGHGLASAMSVARIHGEIERLRDEYPEDGPARLLRRLNRYFHRLLVRHSLFASATMLTIDPYSGELRYASAGHPPVFIRSRGKFRELDSTTFLLGAVDDASFGEVETCVKLEEGDRIVLFTDGAYEARNPKGERFGLERLRDMLQRPNMPPSWPQYIMRLVETFEAGMPEDDLLVAEVTFMHRRSMSSVTGDDLPVPARAAQGAQV